MVNNIKFTNIRVIMDDCMQHELLHDLTLEQTVGYVIKFNSILNIPQLYTEKEAIIEIKNYRGVLPCDLVSVVQVRDNFDGVCIPTISGTFFSPRSMERGFKTQGTVIYTTFKDGSVNIVYNAIPVDEEGYPMILDDERYKNAVELYIKQDRFTKYFDTGKLDARVLQNTKQEYAWAVGQLTAALKMPSISEWENISQAHSQIRQKVGEFKKGFETTGITDGFKKH